MPVSTIRPENLEWQVFRGSDAIRRRLLTPHQLRGRAWDRLLHDVYADSRLEHDHELKCRAALIRLPPDAVLAGPSAAYVDGVRHAAEYLDDVHVIVPTHVRAGPRRGVRIHSIDLDAVERNHARALPRTTPTRTAWDVARWLSPDEAVAVIDALLGLRIVTVDELAAEAVRHDERPGSAGSRRAARTIQLADGRAQSPMESRLRARLVLAGLPRPVPQYPIRLADGITVHPDLAWPDHRVAVEYDGHDHAEPGRLHRDRRRLNQLLTEGWTVLHVTSERMRRDFAGLVREVQRALRSRA